ncbi:MAG: glycosyltransferase [Alistipes sp.]|jgi:glycosyltransferase involved in cell wall biosynthesis|nr:glycosyltransferase [Alistipes sp.]
MDTNGGPLRVLMVFTILNRGGAETMVMNYFRKMDCRKVVFDFMVFRPQRGAYDDEVQRLGGRIFRLPPLKPGGVAKHRRAVREFFAMHPEYEAVHGHCSELGYFVYREARRQGLKFIAAHAHNKPRGWDLKTPAREVLKRLMRRHLTEFFTCSADSAKWLFGQRLAERARFLPNAIDSGAFAHDPAAGEAVKRREGWSDRFVVGHVGRFSHQKNHMFLIRVFERVMSHDSSALLVLAGSGGEMEERVRKMVERKKLSENVAFAGSRTDIPDLLGAMDVFLFPSRFEGLSVAMLEAQAAGLRIVNSTLLSQQGVVIPELVTSLAGWNANEWAARVLESRGAPRGDHREEIIAAGFDINNNAQWLQELYLGQR